MSLTLVLYDTFDNGVLYDLSDLASFHAFNIAGTRVNSEQHSATSERAFFGRATHDERRQVC